MPIERKPGGIRGRILPVTCVMMMAVMHQPVMPTMVMRIACRVFGKPRMMSKYIGEVHAIGTCRRGEGKK